MKRLEFHSTDIPQISQHTSLSPMRTANYPPPGFQFTFALRSTHYALGNLRLTPTEATRWGSLLTNYFPSASNYQVEATVTDLLGYVCICAIPSKYTHEATTQVTTVMCGTS